MYRPAKLRISVPLVASFAIICGGCAYYACLASLISPRLSLLLLSVILGVYLLIEIIRLYRFDNRRFLINPTFLCAVMTFGLYYGITNVLYYLPKEILFSLGITPGITLAMCKLELMAIIGAGAMWIGYWSKSVQRLVNTDYCQHLSNKFFNYDAKLKDRVIFFLVAISVLGRLLQIDMGVYGYASSYDAYIRAAAYTQYFNLLGYIGKIALVVVALEYYGPHPSLRVKIWFMVIMFIELTLGGFLTGFKKMVILPFIVVLLCQYARTGKFSIKWIFFIVLFINIAYPVVERFRAIRNSMDQHFPSNSLIAMTKIMVLPTDEQLEKASYEEDDEGNAPVYLKVMARTSMVKVGSLGVEFYDNNEVLPPGSPQVITEVMLSPLYSWIPRFIWSGKTLQNIGLWYTQVVMNLKYSFSSTAMGILTYLYIGGGYLIVFAGFLFIGGLQRLTRELTKPWKTSAGALVSMSTVIMISSIAELNMDALIVLLVRLIPIVMWIQSLIYDHGEHLRAHK